MKEKKRKEKHVVHEFKFNIPIPSNPAEIFQLALAATTKVVPLEMSATVHELISVTIKHYTPALVRAWSGELIIEDLQRWWIDTVLTSWESAVWNGAYRHLQGKPEKEIFSKCEAIVNEFKKEFK